MFFKKTDYVLISVNDDKMEVRVKATNEVITVERTVGEVLIDFDNSQYNSDHAGTNPAPRATLCDAM